MKIISDNPQLLDEISRDLTRKNIQFEKGTEEVEGAMGDLTTNIALTSLALQAIDAFINYLSYRLSQKKNYIHFKLKDGIEVKLENLSKEELETKKSELRSYINDDKLEYITIG